MVKMPSWRQIIVSLAFIIMTVFVSACSAIGGSSGPVDQESADLWSRATTDEIKMSAQYATIETDLSSGYLLIQNEDPEIKTCYSNYQAVEQAALAGQYDAGVGTQKPTRGLSVNSGLIVQNLTPIKVGDISKCQGLETKLVNDITIWRQQQADGFAQLWDIRAAMDAVEHGSINSDIKQMLLKSLLQKAKDAGFVGFSVTDNYLFPTFNLQVVTKDQKICVYYHNYQGIDDCDWNPALQVGKLIAQGAYDYMSRPFTAPAVSQSLDCGQDNLNPLATPEPVPPACK